MMREHILSIFKDKKITGGGGLKYTNFFDATSKVLKGIEIEKIIKEVKNMENDGIVKDGDNSIFLTDKGEEAIYGIFDINKSINEIINLFQNFGSPVKEGIPFNSFEHTRRNKLTPLTNKHFEEVLKECINRGYIEEKANGYILKKQF
jgi:hypothetical protein